MHFSNKILMLLQFVLTFVCLQIGAILFTTTDCIIISSIADQ